MRINLLIAIVAIFISLSSIMGCATIKGKSTYETEEEFTKISLPVMSKLRFDDIPVPAGFKLDQDKSFIFQTEGTRVALLKYTGRAKLQDLVEFYKEQMGLYNWELLNVVEYGRSILSFERGGQSCIITIDSKRMSKIITISVAPKAKVAIETRVQK